jgi:hypothetical protein
MSSAENLQQLHTWLEVTLGCPLLLRSMNKQDVIIEDEDSIFGGDIDLQRKL